MSPHRLWHLVLAVLIAAFTQAQCARADAPCGNVPDSRLNTFIKLLAPPTCDDCDQTKAELEELTRI